MSKAPTIGKHLDREGEELFNTIESNTYSFGESTLTSEHKDELQAATRNTLHDERVQMTLNISKHNLAKIKAHAQRRLSLSNDDQLDFT
jgi:hypothetical protein